MRMCIACERVMDEVFGDENFVAQIAFTKTTGVRPQLSRRYC